MKNNFIIAIIFLGACNNVSGGGGGTVPGGSPTQVQYNLAGAFAGDPNFNIKPSSAVYSGSLGFFVTGNGGLTSGGNLYLGNANPLGASADGEISLSANKTDNTAYAMYLVNGGNTILNTSSGNNLDFRIAGTNRANINTIGGVGHLGINASGTNVANGVFDIVGGNAAMEWDQNGLTEFFIHNLSNSDSSMAGWIIANTDNVGSNGGGEGWFVIGGRQATNLNAPHAPNTVEIFSNGVSPIRLATLNQEPIDFWTNSAQRMVLTSSGTFAVGTNSPDQSVIFQTASTSLGSLPAPRMTLTQRDAIASPTDGLLIYNTTNHEYDFYNSGTASWSAL